jgi:hypothetical protein
MRHREPPLLSRISSSHYGGRRQKQHSSDCLISGNCLRYRTVQCRTVRPDAVGRASNRSMIPPRTMVRGPSGGKKFSAPTRCVPFHAGWQVDRELRTSVPCLRGTFRRRRGRRSEPADLMIASASTFVALFRHSLIELGEAARKSRRSAADRLTIFFRFDLKGVSYGTRPARGESGL